jgi:hypothetical protein
VTNPADCPLLAAGLDTVAGAEGAATIVSVNVALLLPALFVAATVNVADSDRLVGVPEINPVDESKIRPAGNAGVIENESIGPPAFTMEYRVESATPC